MKNVILAFIFFVLTCGTILWRVKADAYRPAFFRNDSAVASAQSPKASTKVGEKRKPTMVSSVAGVAEPAENNNVAADTPPAGQRDGVESIHHSPVAPPKPTPQAGDITLGGRPETIIALYGPPAATTATSKDGHTVETLIYAKDPQGSATVVHVVDGLVASARTFTAPSSPRGWFVSLRSEVQQ